MNIGTIPQEINYAVVLEGRGIQLETYLRNSLKIYPKMIFLYWWKNLPVHRIDRSTVVVKDGLGRKPTVPLGLEKCCLAL